MSTPAPTSSSPSPKKATQKLPVNLQPIVFGLVGRKGSGKDTVGKIIRSLLETEYPCYRIAIADEVKHELAVLTGGNLRKIEENKTNWKLRKLLQYLGTEIGRYENPDVWIDKAKAKVKKILSLETTRRPVIYFTDVRFQNEVAYIRNELKGIILKIDRNIDGSETVDGHESESGIDKITPDHFINNSFNGLHRLNWEIKATLGMLKHRLNI